MLYGNLLLYLYKWTGKFHFNISEEVCMYTNAHTLNENVVVLKESLDSNIKELDPG